MSIAQPRTESPPAKPLSSAPVRQNLFHALILKKAGAHLPDLPSGHTIFIGGQPVKLPVEPVLCLCECVIDRHCRRMNYEP